MDFINQYLIANSGTMVPKRFTYWSALAVLAATMGRRIYVDYGHFQIRPNLYITLVGEQGTRKGTAKDSAEAMFTDVFPDYPKGASVMSREQIVGRMSKDDAWHKTFLDETGVEIKWTPVVFFVNELKNFMSINTSTMVAFLTDIYDRKFFAADTIKHGLEPIDNPCINILACETPDWIISNLKMNIISGGFSRRMFYVYEVEKVPRITFPKKSTEAYVAEEWCKKHLAKIWSLAGKFTWTDEAYTKFDKWFVGLPHPEDRVLAGFYECKDVLATKIAMLLCCASEEPKFELTWERLEQAIAFLDLVEQNLPRLTVAVGRNELAVPQSRLMQQLADSKGWMPEKKWHKLASQEMNEVEYRMMMQFLISTDQVHKHKFNDNGFIEEMVLNHDKYVELVEKKEIKIV